MLKNADRAIAPVKNRIAKLGNHFYDMGTQNKSFLQVAKDLRTLGVKNCYFMLEIYDISLINVDPYAVDKNGNTILTKDQIARIINECIKNPWYYLREIARIPEQGGGGISYKANRGNIAQAWCFIHHLDSWLCLPRQEGKTQSAVAILTWSYAFGTTHSEFLFNNKSGDDAKLNLRRVVDQIQLLPEYLRFESVVNEEGKKEKSRFSATKIGSPISHNSIRVTAKATSYDRALNLARGMTTPVQFYDEVEFTDYIDVIIKNSYPAFKRAADNAIKNGAAASRIMTSTPGDLDTKAGKASQILLQNTARWSEKLYDMNSDEIQEFFIAHGENCNKILYVEYSYTQIGRTHEWFKEMAAGMNGDMLTVRRELLLQRLHGSSLSPYDREDIEAIIELQRKPIDELWVDDFFKFDIYTTLDKRKAYLIGVDCASGNGGEGDNDAITIVDPQSLEPVAEFECSYIGETRFEHLLISLIQDHLPRSVLCIERNSMGDSVVDHLLKSPIAQNLYYDKNKDLMAETMKGNETITSLLKKESAQKRFYGVFTSDKSREQMFSILARHVNEYKEKFVTANITRDISRLVRSSSGKILAAPGLKYREGQVKLFELLETTLV